MTSPFSGHQQISGSKAQGDAFIVLKLMKSTFFLVVEIILNSKSNIKTSTFHLSLDTVMLNSCGS